MKNKMLSIMLVVLVVCVAMAAPAFGLDYNGPTTISTAVDIGDTANIGVSADAVIDITGTGSFTCTGGKIGDGKSATVNVAVGGSLSMDGETEFNEPNSVTATINLNVYGTAFIEQLKMYGRGVECKTVVGNGTDAATLTVKESSLGKNGDASITVNENGTMIVNGWADDWLPFLTINQDTDSYIDLVGTGTLKVADYVDTAGYEGGIKGDGVLGAYIKTAGTGDDAGYYVYAAGALEGCDLAKATGYDETAARLKGDTDFDCKVNLVDLAALAENWQASESY